MCATRLMPLAQNRGSCSAPGDLRAELGAEFAPDGGDVHPHLLEHPPAHHAHHAAAALRAVLRSGATTRCARTGPPADRPAGHRCASSIASNAAHSRSRSASNQARAASCSAGMRRRRKRSFSGELSVIGACSMPSDRVARAAAACCRGESAPLVSAALLPIGADRGPCRAWMRAALAGRPRFRRVPPHAGRTGDLRGRWLSRPPPPSATTATAESVTKRDFLNSSPARPPRSAPPPSPGR